LFNPIFFVEKKMGLYWLIQFFFCAQRAARSAQRAAGT